MGARRVLGLTPSSISDAKDAPITFNGVLKHELTRIEDSRKRRDVPYEPHEGNLTGLAFSGGGIRSATFNLGILQALAQKGLLHKFDYVSTVSGGGYIGSWLAALTQRLTASMENPRFDTVEKTLAPCKYAPDRRSEPPVVHWLRLYSNYLTPHTGLISGDTWAMLGTWLRNVILNQAILVLAFLTLLIFCQSALLPLVLAEDGDQGLLFLISGGVLLFFASIAMAANILAESPLSAVPKTRWQKLKAWFQRIQITATVMVPFVLACVLVNCGLWQRLDFARQSVGLWALAGAGFYFTVWLAVAAITLARRALRAHRRQAVKPMVSIAALLPSSLISGAVGSCLLWAYVLALGHLPANWVDASSNWVVVVFGSAVVMGIVLLAGILHVGLVGRGSSDLVREWWARLGGYLILITIGWLLLAGVCAFAPLGVRLALFKLRGWSIGAVVLWAVHNYLGIKAASSPLTSGKKAEEASAQKKTDPASAQKSADANASTGKDATSRVVGILKSPKVLNVIAKIAPYVFIVGLVLLVSTAVQIATGLVFLPGETKELWWSGSGLTWLAISEDYWRILEHGSAAWLAAFGGISFLVALALSWRVDVNDFSLHHFYRNRLVRCYLGASNENRKAAAFSGFDENDDIPLCKLAGNYPGPYPIINSALNITGGEELGYATRRAKSFAFTPLYCGYQLGTPGLGFDRFTCDNAFEPTYSKTEKGRSAGGVGKFGADKGISLGTAMAISGAAASPNMGYYTTPATAFFMALFDVRLGWWMGNSRYPRSWRSTGPALGLTYLLSEVFAQSDQRKSYVYLSDGGHFENLAVYELIRRRCKLIVACDADADGSYQYDNLLALIEKARTDFGARIEIDYKAMRPTQPGHECAETCVVGKIYYDPNPNHTDDYGTLILLKPAMPIQGAVPCGKDDRSLPDDVRHYYEKYPAFPHQSTADQWFDELQFESYRALGEYIGCEAAEKIGKAADDTLRRANPRPDSADDLVALTS